MIVSAALILNACHVRIDLSGAVIFSAPAATPSSTPEYVIEVDEVVRFVAAVLGNAQSGAGKIASGPATRADNSNFFREKLGFSFLFMDRRLMLF